MIQVTSYSLSLHEIDTARSPSSLISSAIETMVRKGHVKILSDPLVSTLISTKWERFARSHFLIHTFLYLVFVVVQVFLIWLHCSPSQWNQQSRRVSALLSFYGGGHMESRLSSSSMHGVVTWDLDCHHPACMGLSHGI
jgi:hypothetical protein